jgi:undecaprenyl pyrophosphate phosphatase UppP
MSRTQTAKEIDHLKDQLKAEKRQSDFRLLKMVLIMVILAVIAGLMYGKIHLM